MGYGRIKPLDFSAGLTVMSDRTSQEFLLSPALPLAGWLESLLPSVSLQAVREGRVQLVLLDTFDHRLLGAGWLLGMEDGPDGRRVLCQDDQGRLEAVSHQGPPPRFASQLPAADYRDRLSRLIDVRALLPQLEIDGERTEWPLAGPDDAGTARLTLDRLAVRVSDIECPLRPRLRVTKLAGGRKPFRELLERLQHGEGLEVADCNMYQEAVRAAHTHWPAALDPLPVIADPGMRADTAVKQVFRHLLATLRANEPGVLAETDTEFLHDYRVALRRTRTVLGQMGAAFPSRATQRFRRGFANLATATSAVRDLDVFLLALGGLDAQLPEALQGQLDPLLAVVARRTRKAHERLNRRLQSAAQCRFLDAWVNFLERPPPRRPSAPVATVPISDLASQRIWKLYRRLLREGRAITPDSPPESLHELRKTAKKLRYQMELFGSLYPAEKLPRLLRLLKKLQTQLGTYQDIGVQMGHLRELAETLRTQGAPTATLLAVGALLGHLEDRQRQVRVRFAERFGKFARHGHRVQFRQVFRPEPPAEPDAGS